MKADNSIKNKVQRTASNGSQVSSSQISSTDGTSVHSNELPVLSDTDTHADDSAFSDTNEDRQMFSGTYFVCGLKGEGYYFCLNLLV